MTGVRRLRWHFSEQVDSISYVQRAKRRKRFTSVRTSLNVKLKRQGFVNLFGIFHRCLLIVVFYRKTFANVRKKRSQTFGKFHPVLRFSWDCLSSPRKKFPTTWGKTEAYSARRLTGRVGRGGAAPAPGDLGGRGPRAQGAGLRFF